MQSIEEVLFFSLKNNRRINYINSRNSFSLVFQVFRSRIKEFDFENKKIIRKKLLKRIKRIKEIEYNKKARSEFDGKIKYKLKKDGFLKNKKCVECGSIENLTIDHIIPLARKGTNKIENLQILCMKCNMRKGTKR